MAAPWSNRDKRDSAYGATPKLLIKEAAVNSVRQRAAFVVILSVMVAASLPVPAEFYAISPLFNWGSAFLMVAAVYYFIISLSLAIGLLPFLIGLAAFQMWLAGASSDAFNISIGMVALGLGGLWLGHRRQRGLAGVIGDLQYIMLAPAWVLSLVYRWLGIPI